MLRKLTMTFVLLLACTWCATLVWDADNARAQDGGADAGFKPVASVQALMNGNILLLRQISDAVQNPGTKKRTERINAYAELIAELANLNELNAKKDDYRNWARDLKEAAMGLSVEAAKDDKASDDTMMGLIGQMKATCTACHDVYQD